MLPAPQQEVPQQEAGPPPASTPMQALLSKQLAVTHMLFWQISPTLQAFPQPLQFWVSLVVSTQVEPQHCSPGTFGDGQVQLGGPASPGLGQAGHRQYAAQAWGLLATVQEGSVHSNASGGHWSAAHRPLLQLSPSAQSVSAEQAMPTQLPPGQARCGQHVPPRSRLG